MDNLKFHPIAIIAVIDPYKKENEGVFIRASDFPSAEEISEQLEILAPQRMKPTAEPENTFVSSVSQWMSDRKNAISSQRKGIEEDRLAKIEKLAKVIHQEEIAKEETIGQLLMGCLAK
jgi:hypothetical protein